MKRERKRRAKTNDAEKEEKPMAFRLFNGKIVPLCLDIVPVGTKNNEKPILNHLEKKKTDEL